MQMRTLQTRGAGPEQVNAVARRDGGEFVDVRVVRFKEDCGARARGRRVQERLDRTATGDGDEREARARRFAKCGKSIRAIFEPRHAAAIGAFG